MTQKTEFDEAMEAIARICILALQEENKIMICGNGGSAADAQHLAAELVGKLNFDRAPLAAIALTTNTSILTAIGNDYGFDHVFSRQIEALGKSGDVLIALSTSGKSRNVRKALLVARVAGIATIGLTGNNDNLVNCDYLYKAPSTNTQEIQEMHMRLGHAFCAEIEKRIFRQ